MHVVKAIAFYKHSLMMIIHACRNVARIHAHTHTHKYTHTHTHTRTAPTTRDLALGGSDLA